MVFPPVFFLGGGVGGGNWRRSDQAPASCSGLFFLLPGFRIYVGWNYEGVPELHYSWICLVSLHSAPQSWLLCIVVNNVPFLCL